MFVLTFEFTSLCSGMNDGTRRGRAARPARWKLGQQEALLS